MKPHSKKKWNAFGIHLFEILLIKRKEEDFSAIQTDDIRKRKQIERRIGSRYYCIGKYNLVKQITELPRSQFVWKLSHFGSSSHCFEIILSIVTWNCGYKKYWNLHVKYCLVFWLLHLRLVMKKLKLCYSWPGKRWYNSFKIFIIYLDEMNIED